MHALHAKLAGIVGMPDGQDTSGAGASSRYAGASGDNIAARRLAHVQDVVLIGGDADTDVAPSAPPLSEFSPHKRGPRGRAPAPPKAPRDRTHLSAVDSNATTIATPPARCRQSQAPDGTCEEVIGDMTITYPPTLRPRRAAAATAAATAAEASMCSPSRGGSAITTLADSPESHFSPVPEHSKQAVIKRRRRNVAPATAASGGSSRGNSRSGDGTRATTASDDDQETKGPSITGFMRMRPVAPAGEWSERWLLLRDESLFVYDAHLKMVHTAGGRRPDGHEHPLPFRRVIDLRGARISEAGESSAGCPLMRLDAPKGASSHLLEASDRSHLYMWMGALEGVGANVDGPVSDERSWSESKGTIDRKFLSLHRMMLELRHDQRCIRHDVEATSRAAHASVDGVAQILLNTSAGDSDGMGL